ncbi:MAG: acireductone synthase [Acidobacteria bacterium]|nr:MAG: acireductone synthase [Acidobacteriota bacterium]
MRGILLDIEGTTTPIAFVYQVLFPYARRHLAAYARSADLTDLRREYEADVRGGNDPPDWSIDPVPYIHWLMDQDRKSTGLKRIQGEIWLAGYRNGELHGEVFNDVPPALQRWHAAGIDVRIFSSGSILSQRLVFSTTASGDLTKYLNGYFDTTTGPKNEAASYQRIANTFGIPASEILFVSDVTRELDAARDAGMQTLLCVRPGNHPQLSHTHKVITTFADI